MMMGNRPDLRHPSCRATQPPASAGHRDLQSTPRQSHFVYQQSLYDDLGGQPAAKWRKGKIESLCDSPC